MRGEARTVGTLDERTRARVLDLVRAVGGEVLSVAGEAARVELPSWDAVCALATLLGLDAAEHSPEIVDLAMRLDTAPRVLAWVQAHVEWRDEPGERLTYPTTTLARLAGDCDDSATLLVALFAALGYPAAVIGCTLDGTPVHGVAAVCLGGSSWHWADATEPGTLSPWREHPLARDGRPGARGIIRPTLVGVPPWPPERG